MIDILMRAFMLVSILMAAAALSGLEDRRASGSSQSLRWNNQLEGCAQSRKCQDPHNNWCENLSHRLDGAPKWGLKDTWMRCMNPLDWPRWLVHHPDRLKALNINFAIAKMMEEGVLTSDNVKSMRAANPNKDLVLADFAGYLKDKNVPMPDASDKKYYPPPPPPKTAQDLQEEIAHAALMG